MDTKELFLKTIELELERLEKDYDIRDADLQTIKHSLKCIRETSNVKKKKA